MTGPQAHMRPRLGIVVEQLRAVLASWLSPFGRVELGLVAVVAGGSLAAYWLADVGAAARAWLLLFMVVALCLVMVSVVTWLLGMMAVKRRQHTALRLARGLGFTYLTFLLSWQILGITFSFGLAAAVSALTGGLAITAFLATFPLTLAVLSIATLLSQARLFPAGVAALVPPRLLLAAAGSRWRSRDIHIASSAKTRVRAALQQTHASDEAYAALELSHSHLSEAALLPNLDRIDGLNLKAEARIRLWGAWRLCWFAVIGAVIALILAAAMPPGFFPRIQPPTQFEWLVPPEEEQDPPVSEETPEEEESQEEGDAGDAQDEQSDDAESGGSDGDDSGEQGEDGDQEGDADGSGSGSDSDSGDSEDGQSDGGNQGGDADGGDGADADTGAEDSDNESSEGAGSGANDEGTGNSDSRTEDAGDSGDSGDDGAGNDSGADADSPDASEGSDSGESAGADPDDTDDGEPDSGMVQDNSVGQDDQPGEGDSGQDDSQGGDAGQETEAAQAADGGAQGDAGAEATGDPGGQAAEAAELTGGTGDPIDAAQESGEAGAGASVDAEFGEGQQTDEADSVGLTAGEHPGAELSDAEGAAGTAGLASPEEVAEALEQLLARTLHEEVELTPDGEDIELGAIRQLFGEAGETRSVLQGEEYIPQEVPEHTWQLDAPGQALPAWIERLLH